MSRDYDFDDMTILQRASRDSHDLHNAAFADSLLAAFEPHLDRLLHAIGVLELAVRIRG